MTTPASKHQNYEILNLIGYGLSKFNEQFITQFGFETKTDFFNYCVKISIADTASTVKNRMDLFDPFFPQSGRRGWWQKGDAYIHRKTLIDSLFGTESAESYGNIVKLYLKEHYNVGADTLNIKPIVRSRFRSLQETGLEAELIFMNNYQKIEKFQNGVLDDARLLGDGYDFQVSVAAKAFLAEVKGIREKQGFFRMTEKEYRMAQQYQQDYVVVLVMNLNDIPLFLPIEDPVRSLEFRERLVSPGPVREYHLAEKISV